MLCTHDHIGRGLSTAASVLTTIALLATMIVLPSCDRDSLPQTSVTDDASRAGWPPVIRVGVVPVEGGADTVARYRPLEAYLEEELGCSVEVVSASSYQGVITAMANGQIEFARFGPKSYVEAARRADAEALVCEVNLAGNQGYHCVFLVPTGSPVMSIEDAQGMSFAFTDPNSTSGYLIPAMVLRDKLGVPADEFFGEVHFSGAHGTSMLQVAAGELDIAASNDLDFDRMVQKGTLDPKLVRVVARSEMIPGSPFAGRQALPDSLKRAFVDAMVGVGNDPELRERFQLAGYAPVNDEVYDIIRATERFLASEEEVRGPTSVTAGTERGDDSPDP